MTTLTPLEQAFVTALQKTISQREADGRVRWLYMVNWIASVLRSQNANFDAKAFYEAIREAEAAAPVS